MLDRLLSYTSSRSLPEARAIDFELEGERFNLDSKTPPLTGPGSCPTAALALRCRACTLVGPLTEQDFVLAQGDDLSLAGDPGSLGPVIIALSGGSNRLKLMTARLKK